MNRRTFLTMSTAAGAAFLAGPAYGAPSRPAGSRLPFDGGTNKLVLVGGRIHVGDGTVIKNGVVEITGTRITRVAGASAGTSATRSVASSATVIDVTGKIVTPGLIGADTKLGVVEVGAEASTRDDQRETDQPVRAAYEVADGLHAESSLIQVNAIEGITSAVVRPDGGLISGRSAFIDLTYGNHTDMVAVRNVAIHSTLGQAYGGSRAATLAKLREVFADARYYRANKRAVDRRQSRDLSAHALDLAALQPVLLRQIPLTISAHRASDLLAAVGFAREQNIRIVILGAAQGWKVASALARAKVPVIVQPSQNLPGSFDRLGATLANAGRLHKAGVKVGIGVLGNAHNVRNLTQEVGLAVANGLPAQAAIPAMTKNLAEAFGVSAHYGSLAAGKVANMVVWDDDPLELSEWPSRVIIRGHAIVMRSRQSILRDRYLDLSKFKP